MIAAQLCGDTPENRRKWTGSIKTAAFLFVRLSRVCSGDTRKWKSLLSASSPGIEPGTNCKTRPRTIPARSLSERLRCGDLWADREWLLVPGAVRHVTDDDEF